MSGRLPESEPGRAGGGAPRQRQPGASWGSGLSESEVAQRRAAGQGNRPGPTTERSYLQILVEATSAPVNVFLFGTCVVLVWLGLPIDAAVTAIPVLLNVVASVALESRAKRQLDRLAIIARPTVTVVRDGRERDVAPAELVLGDLVVAARGDQIVLDGEIQDGAIEVDESLLTGESDPIRRSSGEPVLSGSACVSGRAHYRVTGVGAESYANHLVSRAKAAKRERTPLQRDVQRLVGGSALLVLAAGIVVAFDFWGGGQLATREAVQAAAVLVAIVPQGLAIIVTLVYAAGALAISRSGALVQRVNAVESMSRVDTLVLDKTGTITTAHLELRRVAPDEPGEAGQKAAIAALAQIAAEPSFDDRTTGAIRRWLTAAGASRPELDSSRSAVPFASDRRWSGVVAQAGDRPVLLGAPEVLQPGGSPDQRSEAWAADGQRVLRLAGAEPGARLVDDAGEPVLPPGIRPIALLGFEEGLRPDAEATLRELQAAGLRLKVASGDHRRTVAAIAGRVGLQVPRADDGAELGSLDESSFESRAEAGTVFGRVEPALKARLVRALRRRGHYVAMVGDGVNDIIALREANLGLAMQSGSAAARAAADVVLLGDAFAILPRAVVAGQRIVEGMRLVACLLLTRTIYALLLVVAATLLSLDFPLTPRTNSILALVTVGIPTLVLAAWSPAGRPRAGLFRSALRFAVPAGIGVAAVGLPVYIAYLRGMEGLADARTALTAITVWCGILLIPFLLPPGPGRDVRPTILAGGMALLFGVVLAVPDLRALFELEALPAADILTLAAIALVWAIVLFRIRASRLVARWLIALEARRGRRQPPGR